MSRRSLFRQNAFEESYGGAMVIPSEPLGKLLGELLGKVPEKARLN